MCQLASEGSRTVQGAFAALPVTVLQTLVPHGQSMRETKCCVMMLFMMLLLLLLLFFAVAVAGVILVLLSFLWGRLWIRTTLNIAVLKVFNTAVFLFFLVSIVAPTLAKVFYQVLPPSSGAY